MHISSEITGGDEIQAYLPEDWEEAADKVAYDSKTSPPPVCVICGPPNTGKSTFSRHLLNVLIHRYKKVAYMDTDVGQTEFTPPGCLSLTINDQLTSDLAIPCMRTPDRCFFFGDITPMSDPKMYLQYIRALYDYYHEKYQQNSAQIGVPLVVNTPGWVAGYGFKVLVEMLKHIAPTQVVMIRVSADSKNLPRGAFWLEEGAAHEVTITEINTIRFGKKPSQNDARLLREVRLLAYFRNCFRDNIRLATIEEFDHGLAVHTPYEIPMSAITIKQLHPQVPRTETIYTSNSMIVGLAVSSLSSEDLPCCVGLGIVRGVDTKRKIIYLITPVPEHVLKYVDLLLHGLIKIPDCLQQVQGHMDCETLLTN